MYRYFKLEEFDCRETGENEMQSKFIQLIDTLRGVCGFPFIINSGYRSPLHSEERDKDEPGIHAKGMAADVAVNGGVQRYELVWQAMTHGFTGIGVAKGYVHVDLRDDAVMWVYS